MQEDDSGHEAERGSCIHEAKGNAPRLPFATPVGRPRTAIPIARSASGQRTSRRAASIVLEHLACAARAFATDLGDTAVFAGIKAR
jgi:hypothetical protein